MIESERRLTLGSIMKQGLIDEVTLKQRPRGREGASHMRNEGLKKGLLLFEDRKKRLIYWGLGTKGKNGAR